MQTIAISDGVVISVPDGLTIAVGGQPPVVPPGTVITEYDVATTGSLLWAAGPIYNLQSSYFEEQDLIDDCRTQNVPTPVIVNNNGNKHQVWPTGVVPPVIVPPIVIPTGQNPGGVYLKTVQAPPSGQIKTFWYALNDQVLEGVFVFPASFPFNGHNLDIGHLGFFHVAEVPGAQTIGRDFLVYGPAGELLYSDVGNGNTAPGCNYTMNNPNWHNLGADFNVQDGANITLFVRTPGYQPGMNVDAFIDWAGPWRY